ncbi:hypothetical protein [Candidatus Solirubrobacter pratensis]|uniref:hypothetical protein n=1 Tax=Candidatus Solirubrobacter pratensis TaxID=1298857 RepID=UPI0003FF5A60|nr:hypothetical protein [Candidatus Solirubrobacter pratensis]
MNKKFVTLVAAVALVGATPAVAPAGTPSADPPVAVASKTCSVGFQHAVIGGQEKCLRRGQFCARSADRQYRRYGYHCIKRDARGNYHLT